MREPFRQLEQNRELRDHLVGLLYVDVALSTAQISEVMDMSAPEISRSLSRLRAKNLIKEERRDSRLFDEAAQITRQFVLERKITTAFQDTSLTEVIVTPTAAVGDGIGLTLDLCGYWAARRLVAYLENNIHEHLIVGVSWGFSVYKVLEYVHREVDRRDLISKTNHPNWHIMNIVGDTQIPDSTNRLQGPNLPHLQTMASSALSMARELAIGLQSTFHPFAAPGWIEVGTVEQRLEVESALKAFPGYYSIFGDGSDPKRKHISQADLILTGVGGPEVLRHQLIGTGRLEVAAPLPNDIIGDCSGILLSRQHGTVSIGDDGEAGRIARTMIGIPAEHMRSVASRAHSQWNEKGRRKLGVVLIAIGSAREDEARAKAAAVKAILEDGLANVLITESLIAKHLAG